MLETFVGATDTAALDQIAEEKCVRKTDELFFLFSLGSQFDHLIKQALDKLGVFCLMADPSRVTAEDVREIAPKGIILSGGPASVLADPPSFDTNIFDLGIPVLGICLGFQLWAQHIGVSVTPTDKKEFGTHLATIQDLDSPLFIGCRAEMQVLESHGDRVEGSEQLHILASTENAPVAAAQFGDLLYGVQFHPETTETIDGMQLFENFCFRICDAKDRFPAADVAQKKIVEFRELIGEKKVLLALSGGSDSSTVAHLLKEAVAGCAGRIRAVYIKGIDRPDDEAHVQTYFNNQDWLELIVFDATEAFLRELRGKTTMGEKRIAMRGVYKDVLEEQADRFGASFIAQGTLYTDLVESGRGHDTGAIRATIKRHHNVDLDFSVYLFNVRSGLQADLDNGTLSEDFRREFEDHKILLSPNESITVVRKVTEEKDIQWRIEDRRENRTYKAVKGDEALIIYFSVPELTPLADCVKDGGRNIGRSIGVPEELLTRHPFPGPGLVVRIEGEVDITKLAIARQIDGIFIEELRRWNLYETIWQAGAVVTQSVTTVTKGDDAGNGIVVALWAVWSVNGFTARAAELPYDFLKHVARRVTNEVEGIGSVTYRISGKPPATIEWG